MKKSYLFEVISALNFNEQQELALLLASSEHGRGGNSKDLSKLFKAILDAASQDLDILSDKETLYFKIFSDRSIISGKLEKLMTELTKAVRAFALNKRYFSINNEAQQQIDWASWLRERGLAERSQLAIAKIKKVKTEEKTESLELHRLNFLIAEEEHEWASLHNKVKGDLNISDVIQHLDLFYICYRTELSNRLFLQKKGAEFKEFGFLDLGIDFYKNKSTLLQITFSINEILKKTFPSIEEFQNLLLELQQNEHKLSFQALAHCHAYLRNACILLINQAKIEYYPLLHEINKQHLEQGYFFLDGKISSNAFVSIVQTATRVGDFPWTKLFIETYKNRLFGGEDNKYYYQLGMAQCLFAEGKFEEASKVIPDTPSTFYYYHMVRLLELKIYYELRSDLLSYKLDSFRKYIERTASKSLSAHIREMELNFLYILNQLIQTPFKDKIRSARLINRIAEKKLLADRSWLIEKAQELA